VRKGYQENHEAWVVTMGVGRGQRGSAPGFLKFQQKSCFLSFEWEKTYLTTFDHH